MRRSSGAAFLLVLPLACGPAMAAGCDDNPEVVLDPGATPGASDATTDDVDQTPDGSKGRADGDAAPQTLHVLFIGNSYTYVNDVPGILARISATAGQGPTILTDQFAQPGASLSGLAAMDAGGKIDERSWTHVVLQDQSMEPASYPEGFFAGAKPLGERVAKAGARPTWYITWARAAADTSTYKGVFYNPDEMQDRLTMAYDEAAHEQQGSLLACVGEAFRISLRDHPEIVLHQGDYSHASMAGSYLAASTFYVALTGSPVPAAAEVPEGISATDAAALRESANIGSSCAGIRTRGIITVKDMNGTADMLLLPDGGAVNPFDFGTAAIPVAARFIIRNAGALAATVTAQSLTAPFEWTGGSFPGGSGTSEGLPFCSATLAPQSECIVSISFTGQTSGFGGLDLPLANAYRPTAARTMKAVAGSGDRALLTLTRTTAPGEASVEHYTTLQFPSDQTANLVLTNRGGVPTTSIGEGQPLVSPLVWGTPSAPGFPGGSGSAAPYADRSVTMPFCSAVLSPGAQCLLGIGYTAAPGPTPASISVAYSDAVGPAAANASLAVYIIEPPPDAGTD